MDSNVEQELKNKLYFTISKICAETAAAYDVSFSIDFMAVITELTYRQIQSSAEDLEIFSRHGKRTMVNTDDIKLLVRKSPSLMEFMEECISETANAKKQKQKKSTTASTSNLDIAPAVGASSKGKKKTRKISSSDED